MNPTKNWGVKSGAQEGKTAPAPLVAPVVSGFCFMPDVNA